MQAQNPAPAPIKLLAFDWDGTLFDSTALIVQAIQNAVADAGAAVPSKEQAAWVIGMGLQDAIAHIGRDIPKLKIPVVMARYLYHYSRLQDQVSLFDGTLDMLRDLKNQGFYLAVATGKSRRGLNEALAQADLKQFFDATRTADETAGKPHPLMLQELMAELDVAADNTLMIGDTTHDLQLAVNAGTPSVAVSFGAHDSANFAPYSPLAIVHSTQQLHQTLIALPFSHR
jgi:phosphoglycolate phosphatase